MITSCTCYRDPYPLNPNQVNPKLDPNPLNPKIDPNLPDQKLDSTDGLNQTNNVKIISPAKPEGYNYWPAIITVTKIIGLVCLIAGAATYLSSAGETELEKATKCITLMSTEENPELLKPCEQFLGTFAPIHHDLPDVFFDSSVRESCEKLLPETCSEVYNRTLFNQTTCANPPSYRCASLTRTCGKIMRSGDMYVQSIDLACSEQWLKAHDVIFNMTQYILGNHDSSTFKGYLKAIKLVS